MDFGSNGAAGEVPGQTPASFQEILSGLASLVGELYQRSGAARFRLPPELFQKALQQAAEKNLEPGADSAVVGKFLLSLHLEDLALAHACAAGQEPAWEVFLSRYREALYDMAYAIASDEATARELADNIFADLYGTGEAGGNRVSKLNSYTGCGSLLGWMRAVMARSYINLYRSHRKMVSLEEEQGPEPESPVSEAAVPVDPRLEQATDEALSSLAAEDRFLLASYFLDQRTLAEIARTLGVHESTASRRLEKITSKLRKKIRDGMVRCGMSRAQADEALEADVRDLQINVEARLKENLQESSDTAFSTRKATGRSAGKTR